MLDAAGTVLYVGKAINLKKRITSYFTGKTQSPKTKALMTHVQGIDVTITHNETEALVLESQLIKALRPKYNILLRDDKSYPYIYLNLDHAYPAITIYRSKKKPTARGYFGPFPSTQAVRETVKTIQKVFHIRQCKDSYFAARTRPCLQYQIKRCSAPCVAYITSEAYQQTLQDTMAFLKGDSQTLLQDLETRMDRAARQLDYEAAARLRDVIRQLRLVQIPQHVQFVRGDLDVIAMAAQDDAACIQLLVVRGGALLKTEAFFPKLPPYWHDAVSDAEAYRQLLETFIGFYYLDDAGKIPPKIVLAHEVGELALFENSLCTLAGRTCIIQHNPRGNARSWLALTRENLTQSLYQMRQSRDDMQVRYQALAQILRMKHPIARMECFDISHTRGHATVASCVVFDSTGPCKRAYRQFLITDVTPGDDYAAMRQALSRRFAQGTEKNPFPDVLVIDGGAGQLHIAEQVLQEKNITDIVIVGIAKGVTRKAGLETLIIGGSGQSLKCAPDDPALHLLQHIRDEAHRFAITAHRKKRQRESIRSTLDTIPGIGLARRKALLMRFGGIQGLQKATVAEIAQVPGIHQALATRIYAYLHDQ